MSGVNEASSPAGPEVTVPVDEASFPAIHEVSEVTNPTNSEVSEVIITAVNETPLPAEAEVTIQDVNEAPEPESPEVTSPTVNEESFPAGPEVLTVPIIDVSLLSSTNPDDRAKVVRDLGKACEDLGFFVLVNHDIPAETLIKPLLAACDEFYNLPDEEKYKYETKDTKFPVTVSFNAGEKPGNDKTAYWRDYLRFFAHPEFHCPDKPEQFRGLVSEYGNKIRALLRNVLGGLSESLGLEKDYIEKTMNLNSSTQLFVVNYYPPCPDPDPESAIGIPPHTDHGLLTFVVQNGVGGLEIQHDGKWRLVNGIPDPDAIFVNTSDQLEILSNGKYKSVLHRAVVNNSQKRISLALPNGPSPDTVVAPVAPLISEDSPAKYEPMKYSDYIQVQRATRPDTTAAWPYYEPSLITAMRNKLIGKEKPNVAEI